MEPSTWNPTNQHWLSRFLLKGFKAKGKSSLIYERDNVTGENRAMQDRCCGFEVALAH